MERIVAFFVDNFPSLADIVLLGPIFLLWSYGSLRWAGFLKQRGWKTGYTRKIFHFLTFTFATGLQVWCSLSLVCLFGGMTSLVVLYSLVQGEGNILYEAIAREKDAPYRTYYIITPYLATLIGGISSNILFPQTAVFGYIVCGLGDAIAEPVGTRFGRHKYTVLSLSSFKSIRSLEGSTAVFFVSFIGILGILVLLGYSISFAIVALTLLVALCSAVIEAVSPHGWDNMTMQLLPAYLMMLVLGNITRI